MTPIDSPLDRITYITPNQAPYHAPRPTEPIGTYAFGFPNSGLPPGVTVAGHLRDGADTSPFGATECGGERVQ